MSARPLGAAILDSTAFPHIIDDILDYLVLDHAAALGLRAFKPPVARGNTRFAHLSSLISGLLSSIWTPLHPQTLALANWLQHAIKSPLCPRREGPGPSCRHRFIVASRRYGGIVRPRNSQFHAQPSTLYRLAWWQWPALFKLWTSMDLSRRHPGRPVPAEHEPHPFTG